MKPGMIALLLVGLPLTIAVVVSGFALPHRAPGNLAIYVPLAVLVGWLLIVLLRQMDASGFFGSSEDVWAEAPDEDWADDLDEGGVRLDDNVAFTVYRPRAVRPQQWYPLLAFAHLSEKRPDAPADEPDPLEEVRRQADLLLEDQAAEYQPMASDSELAIPEAGELTFIPTIEGVEFNPPTRTFRWLEDVHREEFHLRAGAELDGQTVRGQMTVYLGLVRVATIALAIRVDSTYTPPAAGDEAQATEPAVGRPYRRIFASYSHADAPIVEHVAEWATWCGHEFLRDATHLRRGQVWSRELERMIEAADVFQLFWSRNSMHSPFVKQEWEYALSLGREGFICPSYWEEPMPEEPPDLPPSELARLHFDRLPVVAAVEDAWPIQTSSTRHGPTTPDGDEANDLLETQTSGVKRHPAGANHGLCPRTDLRLEGLHPGDYYAVLGLSRTANAADIKSAYRRLARECHPDADGSPEARARFDRVGRAYAVLSDPDRRRQYDRTGRDDGVDDGMGMADTLDMFSMFGGAFGGGNTADGTPRGQDVRVVLTVDLTEVLHGATREVEVTRRRPCEACDGTGARGGSVPVPCDECGGEGQVRLTRDTLFGKVSTENTCPTCLGKGVVVTEPCDDCAGTGVVVTTEPFTVHVPPGIESGQTLRYREQGEPLAGGTPGDLLVTIEVAPHTEFVREGVALHATVRIPVWVAALGGAVMVPTLEGHIEARVPPGSQYGDEIVLTGLGLPPLGDTDRGPLVVTLEIETPVGLTPRQRELFEELARLGGHPNMTEL